MNKILGSWLAIALCVLAPQIGTGQLSPDVPVVDGYVTALGISTDNNIHFGGVFTEIIKLGKSGVLVGTNATFNEEYFIDGRVYASIPDGSGGFYIGGSFQCRDDGSDLVAEHRLLRINSNGTVNSTFAPPVINGTVRALQLIGSDLYIGGEFTTVDGNTRNRLAVLDASDGSLSSGFTISISGGTSPAVHALETNSTGTILYVGGEFTSVGGSARDNVAEIQLGTTPAVDGTYNNGTDGPVYALRITDNDNNIYIGGDFGTVGTRNRNNIAKANTNSGNARADWNANSDDVVYDIELINSGVIVVGSFENIGGKSRSKVAKLRSDNGDAKTGFKVVGAVNGTIYGIESDGGSNYYVAGNFTQFDGSTRFGLAEVDGDGNVQTWAPGPTGIYYTIAYDPSQTGSDIFSGGYNDPSLPSEGHGIISGTTYQGSQGEIISDENGISDFAFRQISSIDRRIAVGPGAHFLHGLDGRASFAEWRSGGNFENAEFHPGYQETFNGVELYGNSVIVVGDFASISTYSGGSYYTTVYRDNIAEVDLSTNPATVTSFDPGANGPITDVVIDGDIAYVAGSFTSIGGVSRAGLAAIDLTDGSITAWDPNPTGTVSSILADPTNNQLYIGGSFTAIGGASRSGIALVDDTDGDAISGWNPGTNGAVLTMALDDGILYAGGSFTTAGGSTRNRAAAFDADDGTLQSWDPNCNSSVLALVVHGDMVILGGLFSTVSGCPRSGLAGVDVVSTGAKRVGPDRNTAANAADGLLVSPNPVAGRAGISFTAKENGKATLALFSPEGRETAILYEGDVEAGRSYSVDLNTVELTPGTYLLRLLCNDVQTVKNISILE